MHATFTLCVLSTGDNRFLDPTDASGEPSPYPGPGPPWPFPVKVLLCRANEPPKGGRGTNCFVETGTWWGEAPTALLRRVRGGEEAPTALLRRVCGA